MRGGSSRRTDLAVEHGEVSLFLLAVLVLLHRRALVQLRLGLAQQGQDVGHSRLRGRTVHQLRRQRSKVGLVAMLNGVQWEKAALSKNTGFTRERIHMNGQSRSWKAGLLFRRLSAMRTHTHARTRTHTHTRTHTQVYLAGDGRELEGLQRLVVGGGAGVDVHHHAGAAPPAEEALQHPRQLAVPERHHLGRPRPGGRGSAARVAGTCSSGFVRVRVCNAAAQRACVCVHLLLWL